MRVALKKPLAALLVSIFSVFPTSVQRLCMRRLRSKMLLRMVILQWARLSEEQRVRFLVEHHAEIVTILQDRGGL